MITLLIVMFRTAEGSPVFLIAGGILLIVGGSLWWTEYPGGDKKRSELNPVVKLMQLGFVGMLIGLGSWYIIDGLRKILTS